MTAALHLRPTDGGSVRAESIAAALGKLAVGGSFLGPFSTDGGFDAPPVLDQAVAWSAFVAFYDSNLVPTGTTWTMNQAKEFGGCSAFEIAADTAGDFYVGGSSISQCTVNGRTIGLDPNGIGGTRFVWKLHNDTTSAWLETYGQKVGVDDIERMLVDGPDLFLAGTTSPQLRPRLETSDAGPVSRRDGGSLEFDAGSVANYQLGFINQVGLLLAPVPGTPNPLLLGNSPSRVYAVQPLRFGPHLAILGGQRGPFTVGAVTLDGGINDGGFNSFILVVDP